MEIQYFSNRADLIKEANEEQRKHPFTQPEHGSELCDHGNCFAIHLVDQTTLETLATFAECGECELDKE